MAKSYKVAVFAGTKVVADMAQQVKNATIDASLELKPIAGGATEATAVLLPLPNPLPTNSNRKRTKAIGWYKNATGPAWEAPKDYDNTNWWSYETGLWSLGSSVPLRETDLNGNVAIGDIRGLKGETVAKQTITKEVDLTKNPSFSFIDPNHSLDLNTLIANVSFESVADSASLYLASGRLKKWRVQAINSTAFTIHIGLEATENTWIEGVIIQLNEATLLGSTTYFNQKLTIQLKKWGNYSALGYSNGYSPNILNPQLIIDSLAQLKIYNQTKITAPFSSDPITSDVALLAGKNIFTNGKSTDKDLVLLQRNKQTGNVTYRTLGFFDSLFAYPTRIGKGNYTYGSEPTVVLRELGIANAIINTTIINGDKDAQYKVSWLNFTSAFLLRFVITKIKGSELTNFTLNRQFGSDAEMTGLVTLSASQGREKIEVYVDLDKLKAAGTYYLSPDDTTNNRIFNEGSLYFSKAVYMPAPVKDLKNNLINDVSLPADKGVYGQNNTVYKFKNLSDNGKFRIKLEVRFNEDMTLSNGRRDIIAFRNGTKDLNICAYTSNINRNSAYQQPNSLGTNIENQVVENLAGLGYQRNEGIVLTNRNSLFKPLYGKDALYIRYKFDATGENNFVDVCAEITASRLRIYRSLDNSTLVEFLFSQYTDTVSLANAIKSVPYLEADWHFNAPTSNLLKFTAIKMVTEYWGGESPADKRSFNDAARLHLPLAIDETWHTVEVVSNGSYLYVVWDGIVQKVTNVIPSDLTNSDIYIGGNNLVVQIQNTLRNLEMNFDHTGDAEVFEVTYNQVQNTPIIVSDMHPHIKVYMAHEIVDVADSATPTHASTFVSSDRLSQVFAKLAEKGYSFITINDVADYMHGKIQLPKRCATIIYDDYRYQNWLTPKFRNLLNKYGVKASWAWITDWTNNIVDNNGQNIIQDKFIGAIKQGGQTIHSHTKEHRYIYRGLQSELDKEFYLDITSAINRGVNSEIITYPFGGINPNVLKASEHNFKISFQTPVNGRYLAKAYSNAYIVRERMEWYQSLNDVIGCVV